MDIFGVRRAPFLARRNFHYEIRHLLAWGVVAGVVEGNFASVVAAKTFHGSNLLVLAAATTPVASHLASLLWGMLAIGRPKIRVFTFCAAGVTLFVGSIALTPATPWGGWIFVSQMAAAQFFMTGVVTVRSALWKSNYPKEVRGQIAARLQIVRAVTRMLAVALAAVAFDVDPSVYRWVYPAVAVAGVIAIWLLQKISIRGEERELRQRQNGRLVNQDGNLIQPYTLTALLSPKGLIGGACRILRTDVRFRNYCIAQMFAGCANLMVRAVVVTELAKQLLVNMPAEYWISSVLLEILPLLLMLITAGRFARYYDRVGVLRFRVMQGWCWAFTILCGMFGSLVMARADWIGPWYVIIAVGWYISYSILYGLSAAGGSIAWYIGHLHFAKAGDAEAYMGIHVSLTGLRGLVMPALGMTLWAAMGWGVWAVAVALSITALASFAILDRSERKLLEPAWGGV